MHWTTLVSPETLSAHLGEAGLRLLDARFALMDPAAGRRDYLQSHLPGALHVDLNEDLSDLRKQGQGRHPLPDAEAFAHRLGQWGIAPDHQVVVYDAGDGSMAAARAWWLLKLIGHARVAVLDGGLAAWRGRGFPETSEVPEVAARAPYPGRFDEHRIATAAQILERLDEDSGWLFDARAPERFRGEAEPIDPVAGHVPGAINLPFALQLRDGRYLPGETLRQRLLPALAGRHPEDVVLMCGSGVTACHLLLAFEHAGLHGARVYAGSWSGWISDPARPVAQGA
ncbi:sulfurtransferase [Pseudoxanthomonas mexicana]|uniref:sulfurtransferase n=1 Tax=Pseudoxanthomonas mexicana TaxID=128785 RepID=UPI00398B0818